MLRRSVIIALASALVLLSGSYASAQSPLRRPGFDRSRQRGVEEQPQPRAGARALKELEIGDLAPPLVIEKWVKGEGFSKFEPGKIYVLEFWATWCGPCVASIPQLTELQLQYKDAGVVVVGVTSPDAKNTLDAVTSLVAEKGEGMNYSVAWDTQRQTLDAYLKASRQNYIPCVFLIDREGRLAFIGHPSKIDQPLKQLADGTFDLNTAAEQYKADVAKRMTEQEKSREARRYGERFAQACEAKDWEAAVAAYDEGAPLSNKFAFEAAVGRNESDGKFKILLLLLKDYAKASKFGNELVDGIAAESPNMLNQIAWTIVDPKNNVENKDLKLAMRAAELADQLTQHRDAAIVDTLARVYFWQGDLAKAVDLQTKAVKLATQDQGSNVDGGTKDEIIATLKEYQNAQKK